VSRYRILNKNNGSLFTIAAASGSGKTSLVKALVETMPQIQVSISHTTRQSRNGEVEGEHYFFVTKQKFQDMVSANQFLEHAEVFGQCYGTSREWVEKTLSEGIDVILEIDWQGAAQIRKQFSQGISIFILPPSIHILKERLLNRRQDSIDIIEQRIAAANKEISHCAEFDYLVVNADFDVALSDLKAIVKAKRLERKQQLKRYAKLLEDLLKNQ
jgi:guanylate kinase